MFLGVGTESDCIFCQIVVGSSPATKIAENDRAIAFMDINPATPGHVLVVPRSHAVDLLDVEPDDLASCARLTQTVAQRAKERLEADGVNLLNCSGAAAGQTVFHFHLHVIVRFRDDVGKDRIGLPWETVPSNLAEVQRIGELLV